MLKGGLTVVYLVFCRCTLWVSRVCLIELGAGRRQLSRWRKNRIRWAVQSTDDVGEGKKAVASVLVL